MLRANSFDFSLQEIERLLDEVSYGHGAMIMMLTTMVVVCLGLTRVMLSLQDPLPFINEASLDMWQQPMMGDDVGVSKALFATHYDI